MRVLLQALIVRNTHSTSSRFIWLSRNYLIQVCGKFLSSVTFFERRYCDKALNSFIEGRRVIFTLKWEEANFSVSQQEKNYKHAVEKLENALNVQTDETSSRISNKNMKPVIFQALESQDLSIVVDKLEWCMVSNKFPSYDILKALAQLSVESKNSQCVDTIRHVVKAAYPAKYIQSAKLLLYASEAFWRSGNITGSLTCLQKLFKEFPFAINEGRFLLSRMMAEAVKTRSESTITLLINYAQNFVDSNRDFFPATVIWYYLFTSEWYIDQQAADALLGKNKDLKLHIGYLVEYLARKLLKSNKFADISRLLELLLKHELHPQYLTVQHDVFNYHYVRKNINACTEIYKSSVALNLPLSEFQRNKYTNLVLNLDDNSFQKLVKPNKLKLKF